MIPRRLALAVVAVVIGVRLFGGAGGAGAADQSVFTHGDAVFAGSTGTVALNHSVVGMARAADGRGYWLAQRDGRVLSFGSAEGYGPFTGMRLNKPMVGMAPTPTGRGYWLVAADGGVFTFGDAPFFGSMGSVLINQPVVGMAPTPSGKGYWLAAADGGVFSFGDAPFLGSLAKARMKESVAAIAAPPSGTGYWLAAKDGRVTPFGDAAAFGSAVGIKLRQPVVGMAARPDGTGYWLLGREGAVFSYGRALFHGSEAGSRLSEPVVAIASTPSGAGYWVATSGRLAASTDARAPERRFGNGTFAVGQGVRPETYRTQRDSIGCRWDRLPAVSALTATVASRISDRRQVVSIATTDGTFSSTGCGPWTSDLFPITPSPTAPFDDGLWIVGLDVAPGQWRASGSPACRWARLSGFGGEPTAELAVGKAGTVVLQGSDRGFVSAGCGVWTRG